MIYRVRIRYWILGTGPWILDTPKKRPSAVSRPRSSFKGLFFNINRRIVNRKMKRSRRVAEKRREENVFCYEIKSIPFSLCGSSDP